MKSLFKKYIFLFLLMFVPIIACSPAPEPIEFGTDMCAYCKMIISEQPFGAELVSQKWKIYKFDSVECLAAFSVKETVPAQDIHSLWTINFEEPGKLTDATSAFYLHSDQLRSPMGLNLSAFANQSSVRLAQEKYSGEILQWNEVLTLVENNWLK